MLPNIDIQKQKLFNKEKIEKYQAPGNLEFGTFCWFFEDFVYIL